MEPPGECRSDLAILSELATRMGFGNLFWASEEDCLEAILAPSGKSYRHFKQEAVLAGEVKYYQYKDQGFRTPSGKFEIASRRLKSWGLDPLPAAVLDLPEPNTTYPLILTSGKSPYYFHSANHYLPSIRRHEPEPRVTLHPTTAAGLGVEEGEVVQIVTATGQIEQKAVLSPGVHPQVVIASFGWWFPEKGWSGLFDWDKANLNVLTSAAPPYDPVIGSVTLRGIPCAVRKVNQEH
jgi:anaerobic selenocysteine-containing dehydrogenase